MKLLRNNRFYVVSTDNGATVGEIHMDYWNQVGAVVLSAKSVNEDQLQILRLAASHVQQFVKNRATHAFGGLVVGGYRDNKLTAIDSARLMNFESVPETIQKMDRQEIIEVIGRFNVGVVTAVYQTAEEAVAAAILQTNVRV